MSSSRLAPGLLGVRRSRVGNPSFLLSLLKDKKARRLWLWQIMVMGSGWEEVGWWVILLRGREESGVGHNGTGQVSTVAHHLLLGSCNLQEICVVSHIKIQLYMFHVIWIVVTVVTYIRISTPQGAPIWTTFIGQIVVGCIQFTMPHRSGLESYVNTNKNHFVFHSIQSETWCIQNWFQGGVPFIRNQSVLLWVPVLEGSRWQRIWLNL